MPAPFSHADAARVLEAVMPSLGLRWAGFKNVSRQVLRRVIARARELGLGPAEYQALLERSEDERRCLDRMAFVTVSRFYRDAAVYDTLAERYFPELIRRLGGARPLRVWSAGCASGEEPYTVAMLFEPDVQVEVVATDIDDVVLERARRAVYARGSFSELPKRLWAGHIVVVPEGLRVSDALRRRVTFQRGDVRVDSPAGSFDVVLCRNLAFTYFAEPGARRFLARLERLIEPDGLLVVGRGESIPEGSAFALVTPCVYRRT